MHTSYIHSLPSTSETANCKFGPCWICTNDCQARKANFDQLLIALTPKDHELLPSWESLKQHKSTPYPFPIVQWVFFRLNQHEVLHGTGWKYSFEQKRWTPSSNCQEHHHGSNGLTEALPRSFTLQPPEDLEVPEGITPSSIQVLPQPQISLIWTVWHGCLYMTVVDKDCKWMSIETVWLSDEPF